MKALSLAILVMCALLMGFTPSPKPDATKTFRFLALGDSYTIGESVSTSERWPVQLAARLTEKGINTELNMIARTGWTTIELWNAIRQNPPQGTYDLVTLLIGVNDEYRGGSTAQYRQDFRFLLGKAIHYAANDPRHVIVLSIPDWGVTPYAKTDTRPATQISAEIDAFNAINKDEAQKAGVRYVDGTPISRQAPKDRTLIAADGLHPSGKMYATWVALTLPEALAVLEMK